LARLKRSLDVVVAGAGLLVFSPVVLVAALLIRVTMGGPVVFRQTRAGRGGTPFELYKFRTMRHARADEVGPEHDMARITSIGRLLRRASIDELPSLWNILRGDMSLVGPRPLPMSYVARYTREQARSLEVLPGLTGWAVVHGRNHLGWDERFALDNWYVDHQSFALDLRILARTVLLVLRASNVNHDDNITMTEFRGGDS
jgi:sugar transferase EpsL